jgi:hypothetical protein
MLRNPRRTTMSEYTDKELSTYFAERDRAEAEGLYDTIEDPSVLPMTEEQEYTLHQACSWLSDLAKETNSSMSEILKRGGITA